jgi:hypothetical protein
MDTLAESYRSNQLMGIVAVVYAIIVAELLDINRIPRTFVHRDYLVFEIVFVLALWLCTVASSRLQTSLGQRSLFAFLGYGLLSGLVGGFLASIGLLLLSLVTRGAKSDLSYIVSWQGLADFAWAATVISFGWLIGVMSGAARFLLSARRNVWLIGFAAFCLIVRGALLLAHVRHHQPLW